YVLLANRNRVASEFANDYCQFSEAEQTNVLLAQSLWRLVRKSVDRVHHTVDVKTHRSVCNLSVPPADSRRSRSRRTSSAVSTDLTSTFNPKNMRSMSATEMVISPAITKPRLST